MKKLNVNLSEIFDVEPIKEVSKEEILPVVVEYADPVNADAEFARDNIRELVTQGNQAVNELMLIARDGQHPRAFEVVGQLIKTMVDANKDLLDIQKKLKELKKSDDPRAPAQNIQAENAIFVGTSAELQALINGRK